LPWAPGLTYSWPEVLQVIQIGLRIAAFAGIAALSSCSAPKPTPGRANGDAGSDEALLAKLRGKNAGANVDEPILEDEAFAPTCESGKNIFLLTPDNHLLTFDPLELQVTEVGRFACTPDYQVFSMAIQRDGTAWVNHTDGNIFKLNTQSLQCSPSGHDSSLSFGHGTGMAFAKDSPSGDAETLFLAEWWGGGDALLGEPGKLLSVDPETVRGTVVGELGEPIARRGCELTGSGDGTLSAFCPRQLYETVQGEDPFRVYFATLDKRNADVMAAEVVPFRVSNGDFAMAAWGGEYYVFTGASATETGVDVFTPGKGSRRLDVTFPYLVFGAGVSTCAPTATKQVR
jgi:hypothetical protein